MPWRMILPLLLLSAAWAAAQESRVAGCGSAQIGELIGKPATEGKEALEEACRLEQEGRKPEALRLYLGWLREHPRSAGYAAVLLHAVRLEPAPRDAARILQEALLQEPLQGDPPGREEVVRQAGRILELAGKLEEAAALYEGVPSAEDLQLRRAALLLQQGEARQSESVLRPLLVRTANQPGSADVPGSEARGPGIPGPDAPGSSALRTRAAVLLARAVEAQGRAPEAEQLLRGLIDAPQTDAGSLPAIHLQLYRLLAAGGRTEEAERVRQLLVERFPRSPEAAAARPQAGGPAGQIVPAPTPADLFGFAETPAAPAPAGEPAGAVSRPAPQVGGTSQAPAESPVAPPGSPPKLALVQTGSFTVEENARYLVRDLQKLGYPARVLERELDGRRFYRVVVDPPGPVEEAQALLLMLKNDGYEGFLLFLD